MEGCFGVVRSAIIWLVGGSLAISLVAAFWFLGSSPGSGEPLVRAGARERINADVFTPYDRAQYPKLSAKVGDRWGELQAMREAAAQRALTRPGCQEVTTAEISVERSTRGQVQVFVYCDDSLERIDYSESELSAALR